MKERDHHKSMPQKLTIITICYNDLVGLKKTISSLSQQTCMDFEQCVIDGGSMDGSKEYLASLSVPWRFNWISEKDRGIYDAMNKGTRRASGDYVWYLNSGDYAVDRDVIADILKQVTDHPVADLLYGNVYFETSDGRRLIGREVHAGQFLRDMPISHPATIFKKEVVLRNPYRTDFKIISDWILIKSIFASHATTHYFNRTLAVFNLEGVSSKNLWKILSEKLQYERKLLVRLELLARSGSKYLLLTLLQKIGLLPALKKWQHHDKNRPSPPKSLFLG